MLLRWLTIIATSYAVLFSGPDAVRPALVAVVLAFLLSNVALQAMPAAWLAHDLVLGAVVVFDSVITSAMILLAPHLENNVVILYFFVMLVAALGSSLRTVVTASTAISALYLGAVWNAQGSAYALRPEILLRLPLLFSAGIFFGYLSEKGPRSGTDLYRAVFLHSLDGVTVNRYDDGRYIEINAEFVRLSDFAREEVIGRTPRDLGIWEDREVYREALRRLRTEGSVRNLPAWFRMKNGRRLHALISISIATLNGELCTVSFVREITELDEAQRALRENEELLRQLAENVDSAFWVLSRDPLKLIYMSPAYERIWDRPPPQRFSDFLRTLHGEDRGRVQSALRGWIESDGESELSERFRIVRPDGTIRWLWVRGFRIRDDSGQTYRLGGISEDITELRQLEQGLLRSQKMEAVGRLAGGVAHDFNNLLTIIQGSTSLLRMRVPVDDAMQTDLQAIDDAAVRAAALTRQLLAFAKPSSQPARPIDVNEVIVNMHGMLRRVIGEDVELDYALADHLERVLLDPGRLEQVLVNLALNARAAMPRGGKLLISTENGPIAPGSPPQGNTADGYVKLTVADDGCGMSEEVKAHLFEPFFTTKASGGTGLGLATCYGIVTRAGGHLTVDSEVGRGTTFTLSFPRVREAAVEDGRVSEQPARPSGGSETILVVEDEPLVRTTTARMLREHGYRVLEASSGDEVVHLVENGAGNSFELLLSDIVMPGRRGTEVAAWLGERRPGIKILLMSGYAEELSEGSNGAYFLQKPFTPEILLRKVREVLDSPPSDRAN